MDLSDRVPIPPKDQVNIGLPVATEATMLHAFGRPGQLTSDCSPPSPGIATLMVHGQNVGPFKADGLRVAVESLPQIFVDVETKLPEVLAAVKTAGILCVRARHSNPSRFSNHSWGTAIDLFFGAGVIPQDLPQAHRGIVLLVPVFNRHGWFWGGEFSGDSVDSMHFELAEETILKLARPVITAGVSADPRPDVT